MDLLSVLLLGVGLSMDAFAVSVTNGLVVKRLRTRFALKMALFFGIAQAMMPLLGYTLGRGFAEYIANIDHFIAFGLLSFIGGKMMIESRKAGDGPDCLREETDTKTLLVMAIATSIDALAAGVGFALTENAPGSLPILPAVGIIGSETFLICTAGAYIGRFCGCRLRRGAEILGGIVLILIGVKILIEHM